MLNGKKSYIGIIAYVLAAVAQQQNWIDYESAETIKIAAMGLSGVGIAHKIDKAKNG